MTNSLVETACPLCGSAENRLLFWTKDYAFHCTEDQFALRLCTCCGCGYLSPRPQEPEMVRYYPKEYYWSWEEVHGELNWSQIIAKRRRQLEAKAEWLADMKPGRLLDVGAQKGEFVWFMRERGWDAQGVELDNQVPNPAHMPIQYGNFLDMKLDRGSYDCITMWAVLEHVYHPAQFIERASDLLRPGGRLVILVTNLQSIQARWFHADDYPRHLTIFTRHSLARLLRQNGLTIRRARTGQKIFGGALNGGFVYTAKRLGGYKKEEIFNEWKCVKDPLLYWAQWRGRPSRVMPWISRLDRVVTWPFEWILDRVGFGFILTISAEKDAK